MDFLGFAVMLSVLIMTKDFTWKVFLKAQMSFKRVKLKGIHQT